MGWLLDITNGIICCLLEGRSFFFLCNPVFWNRNNICPLLASGIIQNTRIFLNWKLDPRRHMIAAHFCCFHDTIILLSFQIIPNLIV